MLKTTLDLNIKGSLLLEFIDEDTGKIKYEHVFNNVTDNLRSAVASALAQQTAGSPSHIALGTGAISENALSNESSYAYLNGTGSATQQLATLWTVPATYDSYYIAKILLPMVRTTTDASNFTVELQTNSAGVPSGTPVTNGVSSAVAFNSLQLTTPYTYVDFSFPTPPTILYGTTYHIVLKTDAVTLADAIHRWATDWTSPTGPFDTLKYYNGSAWGAWSGNPKPIGRVIPTANPNFTSIVGQLGTRAAITSRSKSSNNIVRLLGSFNAGVATDFIGMAALYDASTSGNLLALANIGYNKLANVRLNVYWLLELN